MRTGHERIRIAESAHNVRSRAHRAGNDPDLVQLRRSRPLAVDEHLLAEVLFARSIVVVDVDRPEKVDFRHELGDSLLHRLHHATAVLLRVTKREEHVRAVVVSVRLLDRQEREIGIRQRHAEARAETVRNLVIMLFDALAEITRA